MSKTEVEAIDGLRLEFVVARGLDLGEDGEEYVSEYRGDIIRSLDGPGGETEARIGEVIAFRLHAGKAFEDGVDLSFECDALDQAAVDVCDLFYEPDGGFRDSIHDQFPDLIACGPDLLILHLARVDPQYRGRCLGLRALRRTIDVFGGGCAIVALRPFPTQFEGIGSGRPSTDEFFAGFSMDRAEAWSALECYWRRLGVERVGDTPYFAFCQSHRQPGVDDLQGP